MKTVPPPSIEHNARPRALTRRTLLFGTLATASSMGKAAINPPGQDEVWVLLNPQEQRLQVMSGARATVLYNNVSWGRGGVGVKQRAGDNVTPVGEFRVLWINENSKYELFFGFDYPNPLYAKLGLLRGDITLGQYGRILEASRDGKVPLQNTPLGGALGIHGLGAADGAIHHIANWTEGCIALDNHQIAHLSQYVKLGTRVVIRS